MNLFGTLIIAAVLTAIKAEVDCSRRPPHVNFNTCCELANIVSEDVKEKCSLQQGEADHSHPPRSPPDHPPGPPPDNPPGPPPHHPHGPRGGPKKFGHHNHCFLSCVVNETGILIDGELQEDTVMSYLNELYGDEEKIAFLSEKIMSCNDKRKDFEAKRPEHRHGPPPHCHSKENGMLIGCVHIHAFKDCPDAFWSNTDECNEVRDHFNECFPSKEQDGDEENIEEGEKEEEVDEI